MSHIGTTFYFNPPTDYNQCLLSVKTLKKCEKLILYFFFLLGCFSKSIVKEKKLCWKIQFGKSWCHAGGALIPSATLVATPTTKRWLHPLRLPLFSSPFNFVESPKGCQFYQQAANRGLKMLRFMSGVMQFWSERGYIVDFLGIFVNQGYLRAL